MVIYFLSLYGFERVLVYKVRYRLISVSCKKSTHAVNDEKSPQSRVKNNQSWLKSSFLTSKVEQIFFFEF